MSEVKFSVVIPYKDRLPNLTLALESLSAQSFPSNEFEIVIGAMENSPKFTELCHRFEDKLNIVSVVCSKSWQVGLARNMAMRAATGKIIVLLDADMVLPTKLLEGLWNRYYSKGDGACVVGQMVEYSNNTEHVTDTVGHPYSYYRDQLDRLQDEGPGKSDSRLRFPHVIPWAYAWTALIALPREAVVHHELTFDTEFRGYGVEDLEWAYRVHAAGIAIEMSESLFGIHVEHVRDLATNKQSEAVNYRYFVMKWPSLEVELAASFGDFEANRLILPLHEELEGVLSSEETLTAASISRGGIRTLFLGARRSTDGTVSGLPATAPGESRELYPLIGLSLPFDDKSFQRTVVLPTISSLSPQFRSVVLAEALRVSEQPVVIEEQIASHVRTL